MSFAWMRRIDTWIGVPLAWVLGKFSLKSQSLYGDSHLERVPERVICTKFMGLGSVVLCFPLLKALKDSGVRVAFWSFPGQAELVRLSGFADEIWIIEPKPARFLQSLWKSFFAARAFRANAFLDLEPTANFSALLARSSGAVVRVGFMSAKPRREALFTHLVSLTPERHMVKNNLLMGECIGLSPSTSTALPSVQLPPSQIKEIESSERKKRIVININASDLSWHRMWKEEYWVFLCQSLLRDLSVELVFPGTQAEYPRVQKVIEALIYADPACSSRLFNFAGGTSLVQLIRLLRDSSLVVSVDSGIMHMAAWAGAPVVGMFGPETPSLYAPQGLRTRVLWASLPCSPCLTVAADKITRCQDNQCMKRITPHHVLRACQSLLAMGSTRVA